MRTACPETEIILYRHRDHHRNEQEDQQQEGTCTVMFNQWMVAINEFEKRAFQLSIECGGFLFGIK